MGFISWFKGLWPRSHVKAVPEEIDSEWEVTQPFDATPLRAPAPGISAQDAMIRRYADDAETAPAVFNSAPVIRDFGDDSEFPSSKP